MKKVVIDTSKNQIFEFKSEPYVEVKVETPESPTTPLPNLIDIVILEQLKQYSDKKFDNIKLLFNIDTDKISIIDYSNKQLPLSKLVDAIQNNFIVLCKITGNSYIGHDGVFIFKKTRDGFIVEYVDIHVHVIPKDTIKKFAKLVGATRVLFVSPGNNEYSIYMYLFRGHSTVDEKLEKKYEKIIKLGLEKKRTMPINKMIKQLL